MNILLLIIVMLTTLGGAQPPPDYVAQFQYIIGKKLVFCKAKANCGQVLWNIRDRLWLSVLLEEFTSR